MAGYWPSFFFFVLMDRDKVETHNHTKKDEANAPSCLNKLGQLRIYYAATQRQ